MGKYGAFILRKGIELVTFYKKFGTLVMGIQGGFDELK